MIATITLNPAVDKTLNISRVVLGTVNRSYEAQNMAGGKGINVAKVLRLYDYDVTTLGFLGGYAGKMISDSVLSMGAISAFTPVAGETRTSINVISEDGYVTEFLEPGPQITKNEIVQFVFDYKKTIENCELVVISGSAPQGVSSDFYAELIETAQKMNKKVILDTSGECLKKGVEAHPFMIKPNLKELESLIGRRVQGMSEVEEAAIGLVKKGIPNVLVSMGSRGIVYAYEDEEGIGALYVHAPSVKVQNTVGSGDSAVAAFAMAIMEGLDKEATIKKCVAVSVANAMSMENGAIDKVVVKELEDTLELNELMQ